MPEAGTFTRENILQIAKSLPAGARLLAQLSILLNDLEVGLDEVAKLIKRDATLSGRIIRISNSVVYGGNSSFRIGVIDEAVNRVGFSEIYRLVGMVTSDQLADRTLRFYGLEPQTLRENMLFTALTCEALADHCGLDPRTSYTAGLLRPVGMLVLDRIAERTASCPLFDPYTQESYLAWEAACFGFPNTEVAQLILSDWRFPTEIITAIQDHLLPLSLADDNPLACLLNGACHLVNQAGFGLNGEDNQWMRGPDCLKDLGLDVETITEATRRTQTLFERLRSSIS